MDEKWKRRLMRRKTCCVAETPKTDRKERGRACRTR